MALFQTIAALMGRDGGLVWMSLERIHELIWGQSESVERIWLDLKVLHAWVEKDEENVCLYHDIPRKQDPFPIWEMTKFCEVTFLRQRRNNYHVYVENYNTSERIGTMYLISRVDRIQIDWRNMRNCPETSREGEIFEGDHRCKVF